ncbi:unnamed protein product [Durusdinium trenchii]|uniref:Uncharacterized protein n=1 Tax=Durusdinium trenchii TaxID=1381693 RepID=A0ABP0PMM0_9DINO
MVERVHSLGGLSQLELGLQMLAPKLAPNTAVVAPTHTQKVLEQLYANEGLSRLLQDRSKKTVAVCPRCGIDKPSCWDFEWEVDILKRRMKPASSSLICRKCAEIRDLLGLIERLCFDKDSHGQGVQSATLRHFLAVNGHDAANSHFFQDAVSLAYAIFMLRKELKLTPSRGPPLQELISTAAEDSSEAPKKRPWQKQ